MIWCYCFTSFFAISCLIFLEFEIIQNHRQVTSQNVELECFPLVQKCYVLSEFTWFRVGVWRCVQRLGNNMGSQTHSLKPLCPVYSPGTGWVLQRHNSQQQHGFHWHHQVLQWFVSNFMSVSIIFLSYKTSAVKVFSVMALKF